MFFWPGYKQTNNHLFRKTLLSVEGIKGALSKSIPVMQFTVDLFYKQYVFL